MAYTTPRTWVALEYPTAAQFNTHVRDNIAFLANPPSCRVYNSAAASIANNTATILGTTGATTAFFNSERWDTDSMHSTVTNPGRITINTAGLYLVAAHMGFVPNASGYRQAYLRLNGSTIICVETIAASSSGAGTDLNPATIYKFAVNDYIEVVVHQTSGGALNLGSSANYTPEFGATWIGIG